MCGPDCPLQECWQLPGLCLDSFQPAGSLRRGWRRTPELKATFGGESGKEDANEGKEHRNVVARSLGGSFWLCTSSRRAEVPRSVLARARKNDIFLSLLDFA